jgi:hypothetical protein
MEGPAEKLNTLFITNLLLDWVFVNIRQENADFHALIGLLDIIPRSEGIVNRKLQKT